MSHPFAELIGLEFSRVGDGRSECNLQLTGQLLNPNGVLHGAVAYAMADTGMGAALHSVLEEGTYCATIEIKINYFRPVTGGALQCFAEVINRGRSMANVDAAVYAGDALVARANGNFAILQARTGRDSDS